MSRCRTSGDYADRGYLAEERRVIEAHIDDVRANMPWGDDRDDLLEELYEELAKVNCV